MEIELPQLRNCWKRITVAIHHKNLQALATEMYKVFSNTISPKILNEILHQGLLFTTCITQLLLKCKKSIWSAMVLKLYPI